MPTYRFENTKTGEITEELMSISEMEAHKKKIGQHHLKQEVPKYLNKQEIELQMTQYILR